jgi:hypothetical protein
LNSVCIDIEFLGSKNWIFVRPIQSKQTASQGHLGQFTAEVLKVGHLSVRKVGYEVNLFFTVDFQVFGLLYSIHDLSGKKIRPSRAGAVTVVRRNLSH